MFSSINGVNNWTLSARSAKLWDHFAFFSSFFAWKHIAAIKKVDDFINPKSISTSQGKMLHIFPNTQHGKSWQVSMFVGSCGQLLGDTLRHEKNSFQTNIIRLYHALCTNEVFPLYLMFMTKRWLKNCWIWMDSEWFWSSLFSNKLMIHGSSMGHSWVIHQCNSATNGVPRRKVPPSWHLYCWPRRQPHRWGRRQGQGWPCGDNHQETWL